MHVVDFARRFVIRIPDFAILTVVNALKSANVGHDDAFAIAESIRGIIDGAVAESERTIDARTLAVIHAVLGGDFERIAVAHRIVNPDRDGATYGNGRRVEITSLADAAAARANDPADGKADSEPLPYTLGDAYANADERADGYGYAERRAYAAGYANGRTDERRDAFPAAPVHLTIHNAVAPFTNPGRQRDSIVEAVCDALGRAKRDTLARAKPGGVRNACTGFSH